MAIKPMARLIEAHITRDVIHDRLGMTNLKFQFVGLDREDEEATSKILKTYYECNSVTPDEIRERLGMPPLKSFWADKTYADVQVAIKAAQGAKQVDDPEIAPAAPPTPPTGAN